MLNVVHSRRWLGILGFTLLLPCFSVSAQSLIPQLTRIDETEADIRLDGFVDEAVWQDLPVIDGMKVINPDTLADTPYDTHIRMFYTEQGIYVGVINYQPPGTLVARMTSRDTQLNRDGFVVSIDPSGEGLYGFMLRINLGDSMTDASLLPERRFNMQWDGSWNGRTQALDDGWSVEYFIPWSMMPLPQAGDVRQIGFYFERQVGHLGGEAWSNPALPRTVNEYMSAFDQYQLRDIEPRRQLTFYPFTSSIFDGVKHEVDSKVGTDIYWRPTTNSLLSATLNPDFGTVESDDVVVNLTAFETFFREKRTFFLEGQDIFNTSPRTSGRGGPGGPITMLNTRRISGAPDFNLPGGVDFIPTDLSAPTDLLGAVKLTGQVGNWRYGTLFASEDDSEVRGTDANGNRVVAQAIGRDFTIARLLYEDTSGGGRRSIGWMGTDISHPDIDATVNGVDMHYFSADNRVVVDAQLLHSDVDGITGAGGFADFSYRPQRGISHTLRATYIDDKLNINDLGFLTRNDQVNLDYSWSWNQSDIPGLRSRSTSIFTANQWNTDGRPVRLGIFWNRGYTYLNSNEFRYSFSVFPERVDDRLGRGTGDFQVPLRGGANFSYSTDVTQALSYSARISFDQDDLGPARIQTSAGITWRPDDQFSFALNLNYEDREALLVHRGEGNYISYESHQWSPRLETNYFITAKQQLRISLQWIALKAFEDRHWKVNPDKLQALQPVIDPGGADANFTINRLTFQARYRWEIAPLSDLFLVYTRGNNLPFDQVDEFSGLFQRAWNTPIVDSVAVKLRYRFGS